MASTVLKSRSLLRAPGAIFQLMLTQSVTVQRQTRTTGGRLAMRRPTVCVKKTVRLPRSDHLQR